MQELGQMNEPITLADGHVTEAPQPSAAATTHATGPGDFAGNAARICGFDLAAIGACFDALAA